MQGRRLIAGGIWLAATAAATTLVWTATSVVAGDVTDRQAPVVDRRAVEVALQAAAPNDGAPPPGTVPEAPPSTVAQSPGGARPARPAAPVTSPPQPQPAEPAAPPPPPSTTTTTSPPPAPADAPPTTQPPPDPVGTYSTSGGVVTAACTGYFIRLVAATPADGYAAQVLDRGPATVDVHFVSLRGEVRVRLVCFAGRPMQVPDQHESQGQGPGQRRSP